MRKSFAFAIAWMTIAVVGSIARAVDRPDVLFIAVDDLRASVGCYGDPIAKTPAIDALADSGVLFERAYCQQAVCNPSRQSLLTGRRPDSIGVYNLTTHFRQTAPDCVTLPEHFKNNGYRAVSLGKIFHGERPMADPPSWSVPERFEYVPRAQEYQRPENRGKKGKLVALEVADVPDEATPDGQIADAAIAELSAPPGDRPLFLAVGFRKPHLPFTTPKRYWELYADAPIRPAADPTPDASIPTIALHSSTELRGYSDVPDVGPINAAQAVALRRGYYACVSFVDAQIGRMLDALARSGRADRTVVVLWSDHGYHLGEKGLWCKTTNYELDTRVPLIVRAPGVTPAGGARSRAIVELLDVYPTLADLCGLPAPARVEGRSLRQALVAPGAPIDPDAAAISQFPRPFRAGGGFEFMGHAIRTDAWRYVEWRDASTGATVARELYDERADPSEAHNLADDATQIAVIDSLARRLPAPTTRRSR